MLNDRGRAVNCSLYWLCAFSDPSSPLPYSTQCSARIQSPFLTLEISCFKAEHFKAPENKFQILKSYLQHEIFMAKKAAMMLKL